ncbi:MAG TPA: DUF4123 domain-containing protein [Pseudomonas sp.]|nr:DUF4123 domain-containing protein [Pseudomonas sp.]
MSPFAERLMDQLYEASNLRLTAIVELARVPLEARQRLMERFAHDAFPLLHQPCFANLRDIGPWLFCSGDYLSLDGQYDFHCTLSEIAGDVPSAWLISAMEPSRLANHLGQGTIVRGPQGDTCLLRFYSEQAFPVLHARHDLIGISELLSPIKSWWSMVPHADKLVWCHYACHNQPNRFGVPPIRLDQACWDALNGDPLTYRLAEQLQASLMTLSSDSKHGTRLAHVRKLLGEARTHGLSRPEDLGEYVILLTRHGQDLRDAPLWQAVLADVRDNGHPLAQTLTKHLSLHSK